jgi:hypothetical protein
MLETLWLAKLPVFMTAMVALAVAFALGADAKRECRQTCVKQGFPAAEYSNPMFAESTCDCIARDGKRVPAR